MFETCDWNDGGEDLTPSPGMAEKERTCSVQEKGTGGKKKRLKRNRQLMEVLRTLSTPSTLHPDLPPAPDTAAPNKRQKKTAPDVLTSPLPKVAPKSERPPESGERLNRQQWRNKLKNKRRNRNKFKVPCKTEGETSGGQEGRTASGQGAGVTASGDRGDWNMNSLQLPWKQNRVTYGKGEGSPSTPGSSARKHPVPNKKPPQAAERRMSDEVTCDGNRGTQQVTPRERVRLQKLKKILQRETAGKTQETASKQDVHEPKSDSERPEGNHSHAERDHSAELRSRMEQRLSSARFRYINQQLYTSDSQDAMSLFLQDPEAFTIYHTGFSQQVQRWPVNPITEIIKYIKNRPSSLVVADFGCGDALLARSVRNKVHSFDLVALNDRVTVCDMAKVPLPDESVDVGVFCLSLMGKNLCDFLQEANRILKLSGVLLVAEVSSRFEDVRQFLSAMSQLGFKNVNKNTESSHFFLFEFSKTGRGRDSSSHPGLQLKPCLYKKR
ncbi:ribosomal RNA-processing protein 8 isoform 2-T2 [Leptodactylus fuscus]|uniref:ribosomal RNA-processing protein 8 isoform X2 n=1 Tax=Leptodactylus fuscus TaxID=238119 RepID=UPI003F4EE715